MLRPCLQSFLFGTYYRNQFIYNINLRKRVSYELGPGVFKINKLDSTKVTNLGTNIPVIVVPSLIQSYSYTE